jgi:hypothetical protein
MSDFNYKEAQWESCEKPKQTLGLFFIELAGGFLPRRKQWQVLLASNGKIYRRTETDGVATWEGYVA